jgi:hypothetical protein
MRLRTFVTVLVAAALCVPAAAAAQTEQPRTGSAAVGADLGFFVADSVFHTGFAPAVYGEFYLSPRVSVRVLAGWSRNGFDNYEGRNIEQYRGALNIVYNWEAEQWHPFATVGVNTQAVRLSTSDTEYSEWYKKPGVNVGVGVEYFSLPTVSIKAEGTYYWVRDSGVPQEPHGVALSLGLKKYF